MIHRQEKDAISSGSLKRGEEEGRGRLKEMGIGHRVTVRIERERERERESETFRICSDASLSL